MCWWWPERDQPTSQRQQDLPGPEEGCALRARATALQTNRGAVRRLSAGAGRCKQSACISGNMNKYFVNHRSAEVLDVMTSTMHGSDKVLTNPAFTTLHRSKACMNLSPGVSPLGATGPGCLGIQAGGAHLHRKTPGIQTTWAGALLYHRRTLWPWAFTLWVSGFPHL